MRFCPLGDSVSILAILPTELHFSHHFVGKSRFLPTVFLSSYISVCKMPVFHTVYPSALHSV